MPFADVHLTLCLTRACNLRCRYCYGGEKAARHLSLETGRRALELAMERAAERLHLIFFGGEPLLRWEALVELTAAAEAMTDEAGLSLHPSVTTNGTLLDEARAGWLASKGFLVALSCDGSRAAHDRNRLDPEGRGSFDRVAAGLKAVLAAGARTRVVLVLDPTTVASLPDSVEALVELGALELVINVNWSADWASEATRRAWSRAYEALAERYVAAYLRGRPFWVNVIDDKIATHLRGGYRSHERCDMGRRDLVVAPSGALYPCDRLVGEDGDEAPLAIGHVDTGVDPQRLAAVIGGACRLPTDCLDCALRDRCRNRCGCANLAMTGALDQPSELLCFHEQLAIRCADQAAEALVARGDEGFLRKHYGSV